MILTLEIKPAFGLSSLPFGASKLEAEQLFGKSEEIFLLEEMEENKSTVWHYWNNGFSLFFDENNHELFSCVEIDNPETTLWDKRIFELNEKQIIELFKTKGIKRFETEFHDWGEKRVSFDDVNIDFYFEKNKLISINFGKPFKGKPLLIFPN